MQGPQLFDQYAGDYDAALNQGLEATGEDKHYFSVQRALWLKSRLSRLNFTPDSLIDFGCGTGDGTADLANTLKIPATGLDVSSASIDKARTCHPGLSFLTLAAQPHHQVDLVYCNGVFHHIQPADRPRILGLIRSFLKEGGIFALWENNPLNPGTRYVMSKIPFDKDAITLKPTEAAHLVRQEGFDVIGIDYLFYFPRFLSFLRPLEKCLRWLPLGGQYLVLCRKAGDSQG